MSDVRAPIGAYLASKYACVGYSEMLRAELAGEGIGVSVLCPGVVASEPDGDVGREPARGVRRAGRPAARRRPAAPVPPPPPVWAMPAEDVGPIVIRAIRANRFHVLTHRQARPLVERRFQAMLEDFEFAAGA